MNKHCYRIIFNKARGQLMVVAEIAKSRTKGVKNSQGSGSPKMATFGLKPLSFWVWSVLGMVSFSATVQAQIVADRSAPGTQQATILQTANGVTQVNIQTPSAAGVSRNTYSQFDVAQQGAILNNSRAGTQTQLGGGVQGNPWLAQGEARVILNEVNASNPSQLNGFIEVAGRRAQVVIANPAGITCDGCGFINANRATLTTGSAEFEAGNLTGYQVKGGEINITGSGLNASQTDYTDLIARSVKINADIWADNLKITTGANRVDAENTQTTTIQSEGAAPLYAIDVAQLGGMYAGKITLIGTELGLGVRNAGTIAASTGGFVVTASGRIENVGNVSANGTVQLASNSDIENSGTINAQQNIEINTSKNITNRGTLIAKQNTTLNASGNQSKIQNTSGAILGAGTLADGSLENSGDLTLNASGLIVNNGILIIDAFIHKLGKGNDFFQELNLG
ncbi:MAG: filamentous hemagglutinin N-terminal domain-containing protein [Thiomicrorhabdus sp.]|nr:filamentous hemagglutinin N-terminal domain-containing protein [Thiomicrorhabdus sp.]